MIREDFLQQNGFLDIDSFSEHERQGKMMELIHNYDTLCRAASLRGGDLVELFAISSRERIGRAKVVPPEEYRDTYAKVQETMEQEIDAIAKKGEDSL